MTNKSNMQPLKPEAGQVPPMIPAEKPFVLKGDFAFGERTLPPSPEGPDFARGERTMSPAPERPDYARGERTMLPTGEVGDFATGEHQLPPEPVATAPKD